MIHGSNESSFVVSSQLLGSMAYTGASWMIHGRGYTEVPVYKDHQATSWEPGYM